MDCRSALEILEVVRPNSDDLREPELAAAAAHVGSCPRCEASFRSRQELDREIGRLMREVSVPSGLTQRLLDAVEAADAFSTESQTRRSDSHGKLLRPVDAHKTVSPASPASAQLPVSVSRRRWFRVAWQSAVCLLAAVVLWQVIVRRETPTISIADLRASTSALSAISKVMSNPEQLPDFDGNFAASQPESWSVAGLSFGDGPKGFEAEGLEGRMPALFGFSLRARRSAPVRGVLLVMPAKRVMNPPAETSFSMATGSVTYVPGFATVAWTEGELVYVCFAAPDALKTLERVLEPSPV